MTHAIEHDLRHCALPLTVRTGLVERGGGQAIGGTVAVFQTRAKAEGGRHFRLAVERPLFVDKRSAFLVDFHQLQRRRLFGSLLHRRQSGSDVATDTLVDGAESPPASAQTVSAAPASSSGAPIPMIVALRSTTPGRAAPTGSPASSGAAYASQAAAARAGLGWRSSDMAGTLPHAGPARKVECGLPMGNRSR